MSFYEAHYYKNCLLSLNNPNYRQTVTNVLVSSRIMTIKNSMYYNTFLDCCYWASNPLSNFMYDCKANHVALRNAYELWMVDDSF